MSTSTVRSPHPPGNKGIETERVLSLVVMDHDQSARAWRANKTALPCGMFQRVLRSGDTVWDHKSGHRGTFVRKNRSWFKVRLASGRVISTRDARDYEPGGRDIEWVDVPDKEPYRALARRTTLPSGRDFIYWLEDHYIRTADPHVRRVFAPAFLQELQDLVDQRSSPSSSSIPDSSSSCVRGPR